MLNPFALFLAAPYAEALFLLLTFAAIEAADRRRYILAGIWGALAAYTRMLGLVVLGLIVLEGAWHWMEERAQGRPLGRLSVRILAGAALVTLGFGAYLLLNIQLSGEPFTFMRYQAQNWSQRFGSLWYTAKTTGMQMLHDIGDPYLLGTWLPQCVAMLVVPAMLVVCHKRIPVSWAAYAWVYILVALAPTWLLSGPRYLMALAVLPVLQASISNRRWFHMAFFTVQGLLALLYAYLYGVVRYVL